ncbi:MAG: hypothetical protein EOP23_06765 [Hyphomicrobiales bacterium]|nr:MAG: hypothetical protein EOP23_06765 [Hyphomicrobiales bacterium]
MNSEDLEAADKEGGPHSGDVALFARFAELVSNASHPPSPTGDQARVVTQKWESSLRFIKDVGERLRESQRRSEQVTSDAYEIARKAILAMQEERERANHAETAAADAMARANAAESEVQALRRQLEQGDAPPSEIDHWLREAHARLLLVRRDATEHR